MFTYTHITMTSCARLRVLMAAPLSVRQQYRGRGIGGALLCEGLRLAAEEGHRAVFLCGDPNYYQRFGFRSIDEFSIYHATIPTPYVMGLELREGALRNVKGLLRLE